MKNIIKTIIIITLTVTLGYMYFNKPDYSGNYLNDTYGFHLIDNDTTTNNK